VAFTSESAANALGMCRIPFCGTTRSVPRQSEGFCGRDGRCCRCGCRVQRPSSGNLALRLFRPPVQALRPMARVLSVQRRSLRSPGFRALARAPRMPATPMVCRPGTAPLPGGRRLRWERRRRGPTRPPSPQNWATYNRRSRPFNCPGDHALTPNHPCWGTVVVRAHWFRAARRAAATRTRPVPGNMFSKDQILRLNPVSPQR